MAAHLLARIIVWAAAGGAASLLYGCQRFPDSADPFIGTPGAQPPADSGRSGATAPASAITGTWIDTRPAALFAGRVINWGDLRPILNEAAGARALQEVILDMQLRDALAGAGLVVGRGEQAAEQALLLESLSDDPDVATRLLDELRTSRGLGPVRYESLLWRNAAMRALVQRHVQITEDAIARMYQMTYGPRRQARLMTLATLGDAEAALAEVQAGRPFADVAIERSTDSSAARGGLLEPISSADPAYPEALRQALWSLEPGGISAPVLLEDQYALLLMERKIPTDTAAPPLEEVRGEIERAVRLQQERLLMDRLARRLVGEVRLTIYDDSLHDSWRRWSRSRDAAEHAGTAP